MGGPKKSPASSGKSLAPMHRKSSPRRLHGATELGDEARMLLAGHVNHRVRADDSAKRGLPKGQDDDVSLQKLAKGDHLAGESNLSRREVEPYNEERTAEELCDGDPCATTCVEHASPGRKATGKVLQELKVGRVPGPVPEVSRCDRVVAVPNYLLVPHSHTPRGCEQVTLSDARPTDR